MITIREIAPKVYRVDNGKGRAWTASLLTPEPRITNESGALLDPNGSLGVKMRKLIALRFPEAPYKHAV